MVKFAAFNAAANCLAAIGSDGRIWLVDLLQPHESVVSQLPGSQGVAVSSDCSRIAAAADRTVAVWSAAGDPLIRLEASDPVVALAFSPNRHQLAVASGSNLQAWFLERQDLIRSACGQVPITQLLKDRWTVYSREPYRDTCGEALRAAH